MKIADLLDIKHIIILNDKYEKSDLLYLLVGKLCELDNLPDKEFIYNQLIEREKLSSTAIGRGVAIPHVRISFIEKPYLLLAILPKGVNFEAEDKRAVKIIFLLLTPEKDLTLHLRLLAKISHLVKKTPFVNKIRADVDNDEILAILKECNNFG
ncbi:MAG: PTS sugar transporter subunit IIA [Deferribacterota bacterium]|nr:PTS sugar transporter subunit IIA [Deferribacterota bacterium]